MSTVPVRRREDQGLVARIDRNLTKTGKILAGLGVIGSSLVAGGTVVYQVDNRYVHSDAYAGEVKQTHIRFDQSDLRTMEGSLVSVQGYIFTLERQGKLTDAERVFLIDLRGREGKIRRDIDDLRHRLQTVEQKSGWYP